MLQWALLSIFRHVKSSQPIAWTKHSSPAVAWRAARLLRGSGSSFVHTVSHPGRPMVVFICRQRLCLRRVSRRGSSSENGAKWAFGLQGYHLAVPPTLRQLSRSYPPPHAFAAPKRRSAAGPCPHTAWVCCSLCEWFGRPLSPRKNDPVR